MAGGAAELPRRAACRAALLLPLRRRLPWVPKVHPASGLPLSKRKGQHIIHNMGIVDKMIEAADIRRPDTVYEVGCGTGELTLRLLPLARQVHTVDVEQRMVQETEHRAVSAGFNNLVASVGNALQVPMPDRFDVVVANLPYQISSPFIFRLLKHRMQALPWRSAVLMLQEEFATRLLADPGEYHFSRLSLSVRLFARASRLFNVKSGSFIPRPRVNSTVVRLVPRVPAPDVNFPEWDAFVREIFSRRRKTLRAQFSKKGTQRELEQYYKIACSLAGERPTAQPFQEFLLSVLKEEGVLYARAYEMDLDDLHSVLRAFHRKGIFFTDLRSTGGGEAPVFGAGGREVRDDGDDALGPLALLRPRHAQVLHSGLKSGQSLLGAATEDDATQDLMYP